MMEHVDRAETYLRLLAERELRHATRDLAHAQASAERVSRAGEILVAAGVLAPDVAEAVARPQELALAVRSAAPQSRRRAARIGFGTATGEQDTPSGDHPLPPWVIPIGETIRGGGQRAPFTLDLLALASLPGRAVITAAMRVRWPAEGSSTDFAVAGPHLLPYTKFSARDESGRPYQLRFHGDVDQVADTWHGVVAVHPPPSEFVRQLDIVADDDRPLARLPLTRRPVRARTRVAGVPRALAGEQLLARAAEFLLAGDWDAWNRYADGHLGDVIEVLTEAGLIAADSPTPGQLAGLCEQTGRGQHGLVARPDRELPERWASVLASGQHTASAGHQARGAEPVFLPLAAVLPEVDGVRFALAGLSSTATETLLHVAATGALRPDQPWGPGHSWWVRDGAGGWHVGSMSAELDHWSYHDGVFAVRLTPPLPIPAGDIEVVVTGPATEVRAEFTGPDTAARGGQ